MAKKWVLYQYTCIVHSQLNTSSLLCLKQLNVSLFLTAQKNQELLVSHCSSMLNNASMARKMLLLSLVDAMVLLQKILLLLKLLQYLKILPSPNQKINLQLVSSMMLLSLHFLQKKKSLLVVKVLSKLNSSVLVLTVL